MPRFFSNIISENIITITGEDARHIKKVLRMRNGDDITITDLKGTDYFCKLISTEYEILAEIISSKQNNTEPSVEITLYQAMPKSDKLEFIIQKSVELGVTRIVPISTKFCIAKADTSSFHKKLERYNKIAFEAAKQCGRGIIPKVENIISFADAIKHTSQNQRSIICYEGCVDDSLSDKKNNRVSDVILQADKSVGIFVGSEGGFDIDEVEKAKSSDIIPVGLGKLILRCETAPITVVTLVLSITGNI